MTKISQNSRHKLIHNLRCRNFDFDEVQFIFIQAGVTLVLEVVAWEVVPDITAASKVNHKVAAGMSCSF